MRILIVNTSEKTGGAAVAANRLMTALNNHGVKAKMLVRDKLTDALTVCTLPGSWRPRWNFLWERLVVWFHLRLRREHLFAIDIANCGTDITQLPEFREADIIHLHWVNQGMLSLSNIRKILDSGKPVVWTMHDLWPATAICHYARDCQQFHRQCCQCPLLPGRGAKDLSYRVWQRKANILRGRRVTFVACSHWLAGEAHKSGLLKDQQIVSIPNAIDTHQFHPIDKEEARKRCGLPTAKRIILFVSQKVTDPRKGIDYLTEAIRLIAERQPATREDTIVAILGGHAEEITDRLALPAYPLGYVNDPKHIVEVYNAADAFVLPSLEDNLPNTIMEAMACGIPCVGFGVGGIPEMIAHRETGYVAEPRNAADLAEGLSYVLDVTHAARLSKASLQKVASTYSLQSVAQRYIDTYQQARQPRI